MPFNPRIADTHPSWLKARSEFGGDKLFNFVSKNVRNDTVLGMKSEYPGRWRNMRGQDIQQNIDASNMFGEIHSQFCVHKPKGFMLLMEDDFEMCPFGLHHLYRAISAAEYIYFPDFSALRLSFGFNGIVLHCKDVAVVRDYLWDNRQEGPTDAMTSPWWTKYIDEGKAYFGPKRRSCAYRHNLLDHIGDHSAVWDRKFDQRGRFPRCMDDLYFNGMSHEDWFDYRRCRGKEFSPCDNDQMGYSMLTSFRSNPEFDPNYQAPNLLSDIKVINGTRGESCTEACARNGMTCALFAMGLINQCKTIKKHFPCSDCVAHNFITRNSVSRSPMIDMKDRICYESHILSEMKCDGKGEEFVRLCTCYKEMEEPFSNCISVDEVKVKSSPCGSSTEETLYKNDQVEPQGAPEEKCDFKWLKLGENRYVKSENVGKCAIGISVADLEAMTPELKNADAKKIAPHLNYAMKEFEINTCLRMAAFMGQVNHETGGLKWFLSMMSGAEHEGSITLGNDQPGDGARYKGRGPLQIRGRKNYREVSKLIGIDIEKNPDLVVETRVGFRAAAAFWKLKGLNELADDNSAVSQDKITRTLNEDMHGSPDRNYRNFMAQRVLECQSYHKS